jgi:hypothetical protein
MKHATPGTCTECEGTGLATKWTVHGKPYKITCYLCDGSRMQPPGKYSYKQSTDVIPNKTFVNAKGEEFHVLGDGTVTCPGCNGFLRIKSFEFGIACSTCGQVH